MRFERKYVATKEQYDRIFSHLVNIGYSQIFPKRYIFSLYYDTVSFSLYHLSEDGTVDKKKIRIRFYNKDINSSFLEFKKKYSDSGWKEKVQLKEFTLMKCISSPQFSKFYIPKIIDSTYKPILGVKYLRSYLISPCRHIRITFDDELFYGRIFEDPLEYRVNLNVPQDIQIIELKTENKCIERIDNLKEIIGSHGLILSRFSKFSNGVKILY